MSTPNDNKRQQLISKLKELFQLDQPDLDFGLYRIMHAKSAEITQFLEKDLLPQVQAAFALYKTADKADIEKELAKVIAGIEAAGMDPTQSPKVKELQVKLQSDAVDLGGLEGEVYDHLLNFFRRYYSEGDFLTRRVYKPGVYAIPYEGEEVKLHWANADQYYIKTSEYLQNYAFLLRPDDVKSPRRVHFSILDVAEGEHGNVKAAEGKERVFVLAKAGASGQPFVSEEDGNDGKELRVKFEYRPASLVDWPMEIREEKTKPPTQKDLIAFAAKQILSVVDTSLEKWIAELGRPHSLASGDKADYTRIEAHLRRYTARNTFDYFIHKDLSGFLRKELDFYIKNEVMHLDDVENESAPRVEQYLSKLKAIRRIAGKIIDFLAQLEDFQKRLWLKKKFVVEASWCVRVGCIPEAFYPEITQSNSQREEWVNLFAIDEIKGDLTTPGYTNPLTVEFIKSNPTLVIDTRNFEGSFSDRLIQGLGDLTELTDGVLCNSENFQALTLLQRRYRQQVKCVYIDPPYNTGDDGFTYKDAYQHSSWMSMLADRLFMIRVLLRSDGAFFGSIDDREVLPFRYLLDETFGRSSFVSDVAVINNWKGRQDRDHIATAHEHLLFYGLPEFESFGLSLSEAQLADYDQEDDEGERYQLRDLRKRGGADTRALRQNLYFPIYWNSEARSASLERTSKSDVPIYPVKSDGVDGCWRWKPGTVRDNLDILEARQVGDSGRWNVFYRIYLEQNGETRTSKPKSVWAGTKYSSDRGIKVLRSLLPKTSFKSPKAVGLLEDIFEHTTCDDEIVMDVFAGSGTTIHGAISANRNDRGERKFIAVEQSQDFENVVLPRLKKVIYSPEWKGGRPKRTATADEADASPRVVRVLRLESYEDAVNNLELRRTQSQQLLLESGDTENTGALKEEYLLRYMLEVESVGSQSLLNVPAFSDPTAYKLKTKKPGSDEAREVHVDLVETFNWLIGLRVQHLSVPSSYSAEFLRSTEGRLEIRRRLKQTEGGPWWFRTVRGVLPDGRKSLVIWRKLTGKPEEDNLVLDEWFTRQDYSSKDSEFDVIYVNGGSNLENLKAPDDTWKVRLIEEDFHRLMFATEGS